MPKLFTGTHDEENWNWSVLVDGTPLDTCYGEVNHSPDGFAWGYGGSGPAQLAYAVLRFLYGKEYAFKHYQTFKWDIIANLRKTDWVLEESQIEEWKVKHD